MASSREIEKLERLWKDNPQGTVFAPFAEALRKDAQPGRAKEVLQLGLQSHPNHIPANIVLGRCCLDLEEMAAAETAFTRVLELDAENVIALKALADITERQARYAEADQWLRRLISVDPSNDEAREQAGRVAVAREQAAAQLYPQLAVEEAAPKAAEAAPTATAVEVGGGRIDEEDTVVVEVVPSRPPTPARASPFAPPLQRGLPEAATVPIFTALPENLMGPPPSAPAARAEPPAVADLGSRPADPDMVIREAEHVVESALPGLPSPEGRRSTEEALGIGVELPEEIVLTAGDASEYQTPTAADQMLRARQVSGDEVEVPSLPIVAEVPKPELVAAPEPKPVAAAEPEPVVEPEPVLAAGEPPPSALPQREPVSAGAAAGAEGEAPAPGLPLIFPEEVAASPAPVASEAAEDGVVREPELVVTETMAELYLRQGHREQAARVYRELLSRNPGDSRLSARLAEAEGRSVGARGEVVTGDWVSFSANVTGGESVADFFHAVLAQRPHEGPPAPPTSPPAPVASRDDVHGAPTRPASDALSLSAIFGEEPHQAPPVVPPSPEGAASAPSGSGGSAFSFDQFFSGAPADAAGSGGGSQSGGHAPRPSGLEEDLDQFQNWLKSLKR